MKTLYVILLSFVMISSGFTNQENKTVQAIFDYHAEGFYYFTASNDDDETYTFQKIEEDALKSYDLADNNYEGRTFNITYKIETETDEFDEESDVWVIVLLELVK
ncbi:MAG: hypothetical protein ACI83B_003944 [Sediminicola sp.]|jgi:hypothetical protein|tara:strand:- start:927 stop:1241 length:315 start_codon:yes stop_codon:yes gene_type:complete